MSASALRKVSTFLGMAEQPDEATYAESYAAEAPMDYEDVTPYEEDVEEEMEEPVPADLRRIVTVHPSTYNEARVIGESFRDGVPVIVNLSNMSESDARRMVDFSAGLVFGLHGAIERVTPRVFLLTPISVSIDDGEAATTTHSRFFNQGRGRLGEQLPEPGRLDRLVPAEPLPSRPPGPGGPGLGPVLRPLLATTRGGPGPGQPRLLADGPALTLAAEGAAGPPAGSHGHRPRLHRTFPWNHADSGGSPGTCLRCRESARGVMYAIRGGRLAGFRYAVTRVTGSSPVLVYPVP